MAESPPRWLVSSTTAPTPPALDSITTAYCVLSASWGNERGSILYPLLWRRRPKTGLCVNTRTPSENRYHRTVAAKAPWDCRTNGVVHPVGPPSVLVMFGR